jgi:hypothetical protein
MAVVETFVGLFVALVAMSFALDTLVDWALKR